MILTDAGILQAMQDGDIMIENFDRERLGANSYDMTLGKDLLVYTELELDSRQENPFTRFSMIEGAGLRLEPGVLYLGVTNELTYCKKHVPFIEGKSSVGRLGLSIHATAGMGDIGFRGYWTLEMSVIKPLWIYPNMPIAQVYFFEAHPQCIQPYDQKSGSKYTDQPQLLISSMMYKNFK